MLSEKLDGLYAAVIAAQIAFENEARNTILKAGKLEMEKVADEWPIFQTTIDGSDDELVKLDHVIVMGNDIVFHSIECYTEEEGWHGQDGYYDKDNFTTDSWNCLLNQVKWPDNC